MLALLAMEPEGFTTSAVIAEKLGSSAVVVRRLFGVLHEAGFVVLRKGPSGGARLKVAAKGIGLGDLFAATAGDWLTAGEKGVDGVLGKVKGDVVGAMNETTLAAVVKRMKRG